MYLYISGGVVFSSSSGARVWGVELRVEGFTALLWGPPPLVFLSLDSLIAAENQNYYTAKLEVYVNLSNSGGAGNLAAPHAIFRATTIAYRYLPSESFRQNGESQRGPGGVCHVSGAAPGDPFSYGLVFRLSSTI